MCFNNENYDWYAEVNDITEGVSDQRRHCIDCGGVINIGDMIREIHQQEHEACEICGDREWGDEIEEHDCDHGETFDAYVCPACLKCRNAIKVHELKEGCPEYASEPNHGELHEAFWEHESRWEYAESCVELYPELVDHKFIKQMLEEDDE